MLSRLSSGIGLLWCLLLFLTAATWGGDDEQAEHLMDTLWLVILSTSVLVSAVWAAVLVREKRGPWLLAAFLLGAWVGTQVTIGGVPVEAPGLVLLMFVVILGLPFLVGAAIGYMWRFAAMRRQGDPALPEAS